MPAAAVIHIIRPRIVPARPLLVPALSLAIIAMALRVRFGTVRLGLIPVPRYTAELPDTPLVPARPRPPIARAVTAAVPVMSIALTRLMAPLVPEKKTRCVPVELVLIFVRL